MNYFIFCIRQLRQLKFELILVSVYGLILTIYSVNWFALNPFDFVLYTRYFIFPGILLFSTFSCRYHLKTINNLPIGWLKVNNLYEKPKRLFLFVTAFPTDAAINRESLNGSSTVANTS